MNVWELLKLEPDRESLDYAVLRASRRAMATQFEVLLPFGNPQGQFAAEAALDEIDTLEEQLTVYQQTSEVSYLNNNAFGSAIAVEPQLFELLHRAAHLSHETQGAFDIATGALSKTWGFYQRQGRVPTPQERSEAMTRTGSRFLAFDADHKTVRFLRDGLEINLGGIGKGYALDRAMHLLRQDWGIRNGLIHGGSSSVIANGSLNPDGRGWPIRVKHPWLEGVHLGTLLLYNAAMGTSSATFQHFEYNGKKLGHVIDPRTGWPAMGIQQVSVIAHTAADADAISTALFVMGPELAERWCRAHPEIGVILLAEGDQAPVTWNLPQQMFQPSLPAAKAS